jgi:hypothetical protein
MVALLEGERAENKNGTASASNTGESSGSTIAPSSTATSKSLFSQAPAPVAFSFGAAPQASPAAVPAAAPTFSFGTNSAATAAAPSPATSSGFSFAPAAKSAAPTPGSNVKIALSPVPAHSANNGDGVDDENPPAEEKTELESADGDWNELMNVRIRAYHYRPEGVAKKFASGGLKVQQSKSDLKIHRMVLRDAAGKVLLNVGVSQGMKFKKTVQTTKPGGKPMATIIFFGIHDEERGVEKFCLLSATDDATKLHAKFEQLSS